MTKRIITHAVAGSSIIKGSILLMNYPLKKEIDINGVVIPTGTLVDLLIHKERNSGNHSLFRVMVDEKRLTKDCTPEETAILIETIYNHHFLKNKL